MILSSGWSRKKTAPRWSPLYVSDILDLRYCYLLVTKTPLILSDVFHLAPNKPHHHPPNGWSQASSKANCKSQYFLFSAAFLLARMCFWMVKKEEEGEEKTASLSWHLFIFLIRDYLLCWAIKEINNGWSGSMKWKEISNIWKRETSEQRYDSIASHLSVNLKSGSSPSQRFLIWWYRNISHFHRIYEGEREKERVKSWKAMRWYSWHAGMWVLNSRVKSVRELSFFQNWKVQNTFFPSHFSSFIRIKHPSPSSYILHEFGVLMTTSHMRKRQWERIREKERQIFRFSTLSSLSREWKHYRMKI